MRSLCNIALRISVIALATVSLAVFDAVSLQAEESKPSDQQLNIKVVAFKTCVEGSKLGKQEQASFEALKKQMQSVLEGKGKAVDDLEKKERDADYLDSLSPEAETEMKRKLRALKQEWMNLEAQYEQSLNQTYMEVVRRISEAMAKATEIVAKQIKASIVLNDESTFFVSPDLDISKQVIAAMDEAFDKENKDADDVKK